MFLETNKSAISAEWPLPHLSKGVIIINKHLRERYWHLYQNILKRLPPPLSCNCQTVTQFLDKGPSFSSCWWSENQVVKAGTERSKGTGSQVCIPFWNELNYVKSAAFSLWTRRASLLSFIHIEPTFEIRHTQSNDIGNYIFYVETKKIPECDFLQIASVR